MPKELTRVTLATLPEVGDGIGARTFNSMLAIAVKDCMDRAGEHRPRVVTLQIVITPKEIKDNRNLPTGECDEVYAEIVVPPPSIPKSRTKRYSMKPRANGALDFNPMSEDNVHQASLDMNDDE